MSRTSPSLREPLYHWGYQGQPPTALVEYCRLLSARAVDIRISPRSPNPDFCQANVRERLQAAFPAVSEPYVWIGQFGNRAYKSGGPIAILDKERGLRRLTPYLQGGQRVILFCACRDAERCHRTPLCVWLGAQTGRPVVALPPDVGTWKRYLEEELPTGVL